MRDSVQKYFCFRYLISTCSMLCVLYSLAFFSLLFLNMPLWHNSFGNSLPCQDAEPVMNWRNLLKCYFPTHSNYILHFMKSCPFIKSRSPGLALPWVSYLKSLTSLAHRGWGTVCLDGKAQQISDLKSPGWKHDPKNQQRGQFWWCRIGLGNSSKKRMGSKVRPHLV